MKVISENPYRIVGLLAGATAKEQSRQIKRLLQFIEAEQEPEDDFSFSKNGRLIRNIEVVNDAASKLNLDFDKLNAAIFWFCLDNPVTDEPAMEFLKEGNREAAFNIWEKKTNSNEINEKNWSAFHNLSTLFLWYAIKGNEINKDFLIKGIQLKLQFLDSKYLFKLIQNVTDSTFKTTAKSVQINFLSNVQNEIEKAKANVKVDLNEIIGHLIFEGKEDFLKELSLLPIEKVEKLIKDSKIRRKDNPKEAYYFGVELFNTGKGLILSLKELLGRNNLTFVALSDKFSNEILQCGIDYFGVLKDTDKNPGKATMVLFKHAKKFAVGSIAKQRCKEQIEELQEWIDDTPNRERLAVIGVDMVFVGTKLERFQNLPDTVANARELIEACKPKLTNIKAALGSRDDFYLNISSSVVNNAQGMLVSAVNEAQEDFSRNQNIHTLKHIISGALTVTEMMAKFDMLPDLRSHFNKNKEAITNINNQIYNVTASTSEKLGRSAGQLAGQVQKKAEGACYIATMAYGDYDHPQVQILRTFRDDFLNNYILGRLFIKIYYKFSPGLVELLGQSPKINRAIRNILDKIITLIK
jgi:hypothetical protein